VLGSLTLSRIIILVTEGVIVDGRWQMAESQNVREISSQKKDFQKRNRKVEGLIREEDLNNYNLFCFSLSC